MKHTIELESDEREELWIARSWHKDGWLAGLHPFPVRSAGSLLGEKIPYPQLQTSIIPQKRDAYKQRDNPSTRGEPEALAAYGEQMDGTGGVWLDFLAQPAYMHIQRAGIF